jgi:hypothetical protein
MAANSIPATGIPPRGLPPADRMDPRRPRSREDVPRRRGSGRAGAGAGRGERGDVRPQHARAEAVLDTARSFERSRIDGHAQRLRELFPVELSRALRQVERALEQPPSMSCAMSRSRKVCSVPLREGRLGRSQVARTICQRRSITITAASPHPRSRGRRSLAARAPSRAAPAGSGSSRRRCAGTSSPSSAWKPSSNSSCRCLRRKPKSFRFISSRLRMNSSCRVGSRFGLHRSIATASLASAGLRGAQWITAG